MKLKLLIVVDRTPCWCCDGPLECLSSHVVLSGDGGLASVASDGSLIIIDSQSVDLINEGEKVTAPELQTLCRELCVCACVCVWKDFCFINYCTIVFPYILG